MAITLTDNMQTPFYLSRLFSLSFATLSQKYLRHLSHYQDEKRYLFFSKLHVFYQRLLLSLVTVPKTKASHYLLHHTVLYQKLYPLLLQNLASRSKSTFSTFPQLVASISERCFLFFGVTQRSNLPVSLQLPFLHQFYSKLSLHLQNQCNSVLLQDLFCSYKVLT